jgi:hypothetical protein
VAIRRSYVSATAIPPVRSNVRPFWTAREPLPPALALSVEAPKAAMGDRTRFTVREQRRSGLPFFKGLLTSKIDLAGRQLTTRVAGPAR